MKKEQLIKSARFAGIAALPLGVVGLVVYYLAHLYTGWRAQNRRLVTLDLSERELPPDSIEDDPELMDRYRPLASALQAHRGGEALDA